jgi:phosphate transport system permease protein
MEMNLFTERGRPALPNAVYAEYRAAKDNGTPLPLDELDRPVKRGGLGHAMLGSLMIVGLATLGAVPVGFFAAVYLAESRSSRFANTLRFLAELLGGVPSIVIGIFAYAMLVYPVWLGGVAWGYSGVAGAFALGVMMVPIIIRSTEEAMKLVPDSLRQASYALGASRMQTILGVVVPASLPAILTGIFLAIGRIAGETAPLLLTAGNIDRWPSTAANPTPFLPYYIFTYSRGAYHDQRDQAWAATLVLLVFILTLNVGIRLLTRRSRVASE